MIHVPDVFLDALRPGKSIPSTNLAPPCDTGTHGKSPRLAWSVMRCLIRNRWAWSDKTHFTSEDIPELRQFIQAEPAQYPAHTSNSMVITSDVQARADAFSAINHGPKFSNRKTTSFQSDALLQIKYRSNGVALDQDGDQQEDRRQNNKT